MTQGTLPPEDRRPPHLYAPSHAQPAQLWPFPGPPALSARFMISDGFAQRGLRVLGSNSFPMSSPTVKAKAKNGEHVWNECHHVTPKVDTSEGMIRENVCAV